MHHAKILHTLSCDAHTHRETFPFGRLIQTVPDTHTHPTQHQRESVMSVVEGVDTALSTNMLISNATETLHPSAVLEMGHNAANNKKSHDVQMKTHQYACINT